jgi:ubiquinone/menaquinone biosynthesis C-methylase UbiE
MKELPINPFANRDIVVGYEAWYETTGRRADYLEKALLNWLLAIFPQARTILEVGCGTGHFTRWFNEQGLQAVGLDISPLMLAEAIRLGSSLCLQGNALNLRFPSEAFDLVALITTLEFISDPGRPLTEALRVTRGGLILGGLNRQSRLGRQLRAAGGPVWEAANFFTPGEIVQLVEQAAAGQEVKMVWQTTLWPMWPGALPLPWGGFIGVAVKLW